MRWFKHMSDAHDDEALVIVRQVFGLAGYARYFLILETVAGRSKGDCFELALSWREWATILEGKSSNLRAFLEHLENAGLMQTESTASVLKIKIPKLATIRDNWSRRSVVTTETTPQLLRRVDTDTDTEKKKISDLEDPQSSSPKSRSRAPDPKTVKSLFNFWQDTCDHPLAEFTPERRNKIVARLKQGYSAEFIALAIVGCSREPHNQGDNERGRRFDDIELICRNGANLERFNSYAACPPKRQLTKAEARVARNRQLVVEMEAKYGAPDENPRLT